jgi:uncharacterized membrane protein YraQ (UPF0718 family)
MNIVTYLIVGILLLISFVKSKEKTKKAFMVTKKSFMNIGPGLLILVGFVGITLGIITTETISRVLGESTGILGTFIAAILGGTILIPAVMAFPLAGTLLRSGATVPTVTAFISTSVMIGLANIPVEVKAFGKKFAILRNSLSFILALLLAWLLGVLL